MPIGYDKVNFRDVAETSWYGKAVGFIAARGIITGTGSSKYNPDAKLTHGELIVMLMKACGIVPDANTMDNFQDAGNTYYTGYLAAVKRLDISAGRGDNMFLPKKEITCQEMSTLLYNTLKAVKQLPQGDSGKTLSGFTDAGKIGSWMDEGSNDAAGQNRNHRRQRRKTHTAQHDHQGEMAQVLYHLLSK